MDTIHTKPKAATLRIYIGFKEAGETKKAAIIMKARSVKMEPSEFFMDAIKKVYPDLKL